MLTGSDKPTTRPGIELPGGIMCFENDKGGYDFMDRKGNPVPTPKMPAKPEETIPDLGLGDIRF